MTTTIHTDHGVQCWRCSGTRWVFNFERLGGATCLSCGVAEGPLLLVSTNVLPAPKTESEAIDLHRQFLARH
jgi:hypothetical protein